MMSEYRHAPAWLHYVFAPVLAAAVCVGHASACGLEGDDVSIRRGAMNWAYPDSLHVLGAVASAQHTGLLDRMPGFDAAATSSPADNRFAMLRVTSWLWKLRARLEGATPAAPQPALAVVLLEPMLWSRIATEAGILRLAVHVPNPAPDDVVVVTEEPVVAALGDGRLSGREALARGLVRLYGGATEVAATRDWLEAIAP